MRTSNERGVAMIATLLMLMLMTALTVGFTAVVMSDQRFRGIDRDRTQAFYASQGGLEKLTAGLGTLFFQDIAPTAAQVQALTTTPPAITNISFTKSDGTSGYTITQTSTPQYHVIESGPYEGLIGLTTPYSLDVTSRTLAGGEVHLNRTVQTVAIPVFQFGMFSDVDLAFFAGADFQFGGRVHTNGNLFLSQGGGTLTLGDKVTAVKDVIRQNLENSASIDDPSAHTGTVKVATGTNSYRNLDRTEGSLTGDVGSSVNSSWNTISLSAYNGWIRNGKTGAKPLNLPLITVGGTNPDLIRRPAAPNEDITSPTLYKERDYTQASLRILLSDTAVDITSLPGLTGDAPVSLESQDWANATVFNTVATSYGTGTATTPIAHARVAGSLWVPSTSSYTINLTSGNPADFQIPGYLMVPPNTFVVCTGRTASDFTGCTTSLSGGTDVYSPYMVPRDTGLTGGYIKIELQDNANVWHDVTNEILQLGFSAPSSGTSCGASDPTPDAVIRIQRIREQTNTCNPALLSKYDYWPQVLFDTREALTRDVTGAPPASGLPTLNGVMYYVALDVHNLKRWFEGSIGATGSTALNNSGAGYAVYFSDRRGNRNASNQETGEYGFEDIVNPSAQANTPNGVLDEGEDVNANGILDTYGKTPHFYVRGSGYNTTSGYTNSAVASQQSLSATATPIPIGFSQGTVPALIAESSRPIFFRRALKLINGSLGQIPTPGLTVVSENPVYLQGDWNANAAGATGDPHVATAIIADAVTLLSNNWNDIDSLAHPYNFTGVRQRPANSYYRVAIIGGKNPHFHVPSWTVNNNDFGTDGGAHNFLRMLESGGTVYYRGSIATFFYSRQATGIYKYNGAYFYGAPNRQFVFDSDFLDPAKLPPLTPVFRDLNTTGFSQELRPLK